MGNGIKKKIYTCPMHPEITQERPGRCSKCGMELILSEGSDKPSRSEAKTANESNWLDYMPLIVVLLIITASALIAALSNFEGVVGFFWYQFVLYFMTGFFLTFATFKLMDLKGFAQGYFTYDLLAKKWFGYGYVYPFLELAFGLLMLAGFHPDWLLWTEFGLMIFSGLGVAIKFSRGEKFQCACLGTFLKVPLTKITLIEDFGMAALALALIIL